MLTMKINGTDITPLIKNQGVKWTRSDVDGPNAGRLMTGDLVRDRITTKIRWDISCIPLTEEQLAMMLTLIEPEWVTVEYTDLATRTAKTAQFYSNNFSVSVLLRRKDGTDYWDGLSFPLIMK